MPTYAQTEISSGVNAINELFLGYQKNTINISNVVAVGPSYTQSALSGGVYGIDELPSTLGWLQYVYFISETTPTDKTLYGAINGTSQVEGTLQSSTAIIQGTSLGSSNVLGDIAITTRLVGLSVGTSKVDGTLERLEESQIHYETTTSRTYTW